MLRRVDRGKREPFRFGYWKGEDKQQSAISEVRRKTRPKNEIPYAYIKIALINRRRNQRERPGTGQVTYRLRGENPVDGKSGNADRKRGKENTSTSRAPRDGAFERKKKKYLLQLTNDNR